TCLTPDPGDRIINDMPRRPLSAAAAYLAHKGIDKDFAAGGMIHLRVKLDAVKFSGNVLYCTDRCVRGRSYHLEPGRDLLHMVAMTHPDRAFPFLEKGFEQRARLTFGKEI